MHIREFHEDDAAFLMDESRRVGSAEHLSFPQTVKEVQEAVRWAAASGVSITIQGGQTGISGGCVPEGGLILNLSRMDAIGPIEQHQMHVEPGARLAAIRAQISATAPDLFFPSDLTETTASIGGMVANNASGARSFKYGAIRRWIQALDVVLATGERVHLKRGLHQADGLRYTIGSLEGELPPLQQPRVKSAAGYFIQPDMDLVDLFIGAEGTLGIIVGITLQLDKRPAQMIGLTAFFPSEQQAIQVVQRLRKQTTPVAIEFFDSRALNLLRRMKAEHSAFADLPELHPSYHTCLYVEFEDVLPECALESLEEALECWLSEGDQEIAQLKRFRHALPESVNLLIGERKKQIPGLTKLGTDMSVPDEQLLDVMQLYHEGLNEAGLDYVIFGHIGNNHLHVNILPRSLEEYDQGKALYLKWAQRVVDWGGSVSAEHGIGKNKTDFLSLMLGPKQLADMKQLKAHVDPLQLLNRGNLFAGSPIDP